MANEARRAPQFAGNNSLQFGHAGHCVPIGDAEIPPVVPALKNGRRLVTTRRKPVSFSHNYQTNLGQFGSWFKLISTI